MRGADYKKVEEKAHRLEGVGRQVCTASINLIRACRTGHSADSLTTRIIDLYVLSVKLTSLTNDAAMLMSTLVELPDVTYAPTPLEDTDDDNVRDD